MYNILKRILIASLLTFLIALLTVPGFRSHIYFLNFVDEDDNFVIGQYLNEGKKLYQDIFSQHQPIPYHISSVIQRVAQPDNLFMTVKRHREFMIISSLAWIFLLIARFGWPLFVASALIELTKINLLGNLFLAESLVVYPLLYVLSYFIFHPTHKSDIESWLIVALIWGLFFSLAPIWPLLFALLLYLFACRPDKRLVSIQVLVVGLLFAWLLFGQGTLMSYWHDVIYINYHYYIPLTSQLGMGESIFRALLSPLLVHASQGNTPLLAFIRVLSLSFLFIIYWLIKDKKYSRVLLWVVLLFLANIRYIDPSNTLYGAFHMLPWFSMFVLLTVAELPRLWSAQVFARLTVIILIIALTWAGIGVARQTLWDSRDPKTDYYVNYSPQEDILKAVEILSRESEQTVWVEPVLYWPYWQTGAQPYSRMIFYYGWMDQTPPLKQELNDLFARELPTLVWAKTQDGIGPHLSEFIQLSRDDKPIDLYLRKDKLLEISNSAIQELEYYRFEIN